ncbi:hypothetical protein ACTJI8_06905 [Microbacterium sp. 22303]|uniref:hypothetical protein n=1 Tax=Microbacterium sp. 22303 TaxID=3453905 RepID=UPI003F83F5BD
MDVTVWSGHRLRVGLLSGACLALGWAALSVILGSSPAHADDSGSLLGDAGGLLGGTSTVIASTVSDTATAVAGTADAIVAPVQSIVQEAAPAVSDAADASQPVLDGVASAPAGPGPVENAVTDPGGTVSGVVPDVLAPVSSVLASSPLSSLTAPIADAVTSVPIVGVVSGELSVPALLGRLSDTIDGVTGTLTPPSGGVIPSDPLVVSPVVGRGTDGAGGRGTDPLPPAPITVSGSAAGPPLRLDDRSHRVSHDVAGAGAGSTAPPLPSAPPPPRAPEPWAAGAGLASSSAGSGGSSASWFAAFSTLHAAAPSLGAPFGAAADDALPSSPVFPTDVSPD